MTYPGLFPAACGLSDDRRHEDMRMTNEKTGCCQELRQEARRASTGTPGCCHEQPLSAQTTVDSTRSRSTVGQPPIRPLYNPDWALKRDTCNFANLRFDIGFYTQYASETWLVIVMIC